MIEAVQEKLVVKYTIPDGIAPELDKALIKLLKAHGWHWWASGTDLETGERDLAFDRGPANSLPSPGVVGKWLDALEAK